MQRVEIEMVLTDNELAAIQARHEQRLRGICQGKRLPSVITIAPYQVSVPQWGEYDVEEWLDDACNRLAEQRDLLADTINYRPLSLSVNRAGHHFVGAALGCRMGEDASGTMVVLPEGRLSWDEQTFYVPDPLGCPLVREALEVVDRILDITKGRIPIELPHIPSPLMLAVDLFGEEFLIALADEDIEPSRRLLEELTLFGERLAATFIQRFPDAPLRGYYTGGWNLMPLGYSCLLGCTTQLVSPTTYAELIADLDQRLLGRPWQGGCMHLCGHHTQHAATWGAMPELKALQLNDAACDDLEIYFRNLREDQFLIVMPTDSMPVQECLRITKGERLVLSTVVQDVIPCE